jgi:hypothetical protein
VCGRARGRAGGTATKAATTSGKAKTCLIPHFILPRAKPPARPHAPVLEPGQRHVQRGVAAEGRGGVAALEPAVEDGHDAVPLLQQARRHRARGRSGDDRGPRRARERGRGLVDGFVARFRDFEHQRPVRARGRGAPRPAPAPAPAARPAQRRQRHGRGGRVAGGVVGEDRGPIKVAVGLRKVEPASVAVRARPAHAKPDDVRGRVGQAGRQVGAAGGGQGGVERRGREQRAEPDRRAGRERRRLGRHVHPRHRHAVRLVGRGEQGGGALPDGARAAAAREAKRRVGPPPARRALGAAAGAGAGPAAAVGGDAALDGAAQVQGRDPLSEPGARHRGRARGPHLEVVGAHEEVGDALPHRPHDPIVKRDRFGRRRRGLHGGRRGAREAARARRGGQRAQVRLKRVRDPGPQAAHRGDAGVGGPPGGAAGGRGEGRVDERVEVGGVREYDVAPHVEQEAFRGDHGAGEAAGLGGLREGRLRWVRNKRKKRSPRPRRPSRRQQPLHRASTPPKTPSFSHRVHQQPVVDAVLRQPVRGAQAGGAGAHDQDADLEGEVGGGRAGREGGRRPAARRPRRIRPPTLPYLRRQRPPRCAGAHSGGWGVGGRPRRAARVTGAGRARPRSSLSPPGSSLLTGSPPATPPRRGAPPP